MAQSRFENCPGSSIQQEPALYTYQTAFVTTKNGKTRRYSQVIHLYFLNQLPLLFIWMKKSPFNRTYLYKKAYCSLLTVLPSLLLNAILYTPGGEEALEENMIIYAITI